MSNRTRILVSTILIMAGGMFCAAAVTMAILYKIELKEHRHHLVEIAKGQAHFMEAVARFDAIHSQDDYPGGAREATLSQIAAAHEHHPGFGETGEFVVAQREGDQIVFLFPYRHGDGSDPDPIPWGSELADPMRRALSGQEGALIGLDYRGERVLAAYHPVAVLNLGVVAKADLAEVRAPFVLAALVTGGVTVLLVLVGTGLTLRVTDPLVRRLQESEEQLRLAITEAPFPIMIHAEGGEVIRINKIWTELSGYAPEEIRTLSEWTERASGQREEVVGSRIDKVFERDTRVEEGEYSITPRHGDSLIWDFSSAPLGKLPDGRRLVISMAKDITKHRRAEEAIRAAQEALLDQQRREKEHIQTELEKVRNELVTRTRLATIGQVSASIGHELRNPLGSVRNAVYLLKRRVPEGDPKWAEYLDMIDQEVNRANRTIGNLMEMSRPKEPYKQEADLGQVVQQACAEANLPAGVRWRMSLDPDPFLLSADPGQLRQVLSNLLINAVQAMDGAGQITLAATRAGDYDSIIVEDDGPGIAPEQREHVFEALFSTKARGTGLGLAICRQVIERHGGTIELCEGKGGGAAFQIQLPRLVQREVLISRNSHAGRDRSANENVGPDC